MGIAYQVKIKTGDGWREIGIPCSQKDMEYTRRRLRTLGYKVAVDLVEVPDLPADCEPKYSKTGANPEK